MLRKIVYILKPAPDIMYSPIGVSDQPIAESTRLNDRRIFFLLFLLRIQSSSGPSSVCRLSVSLTASSFSDSLDIAISSRRELERVIMKSNPRHVVGISWARLNVPMSFWIEMMRCKEILEYMANFHREASS